MDRIYVMQLVRSFRIGEISRRTFLTRASAALGSVAAANLLLAACQPIRPEDAPPVVEEGTSAVGGTVPPPPEAAGLTTEMVEYPDDEDETLTGYLARPDSGEPAPAIVLIQEWWGVDNHIKDVTNRFAQQGYVVLAPDLYKGQVATEPDEARKLVMELDMEEAVNEIQQAITFLLDQEYVSGDSVGIVGFCMGGRLSLQTGLVEDRLGAVVAFYGTPLTPEEVQQVQAPVLGLYGSEDGGIPVESVNTMQDALNEAGIDNEIEVYEGAQHAFFNDTRADSYDPDASADAWEKSLAWFEQYLAG